MAEAPVPHTATHVAHSGLRIAAGVPAAQPLPTPQVLRDRLATTTAELARTGALMQRALVGQDQHTALEVAEAIEAAARQLHSLQLLAARAVNDSAPAPLRGGMLVDHHAEGLAARSSDPAVSTAAAENTAVWWGSEPSTLGSMSRRSPYRRAGDAMAARLRIPRREANRRIRLALEVTPRLSPTGAWVPARYERVAELIDQIDHAAAAHVIHATTRAHAAAGPQEADRVEAHLAEQARTFDPDTVSRMADRVVAYLDPDGAAPRERDPHLTPGVTVGATRGGLTPVRIVVDALGLETLQTIFDAGTNPRAHAPDATDATDTPEAALTGTTVGVRAAAAHTEPAAAAEPAATHASAPASSAPAERRTRARLMLDALLAACAAALRSQALPRTGGLPTQVIVTMPLSALSQALAGASPPAPRSRTRALRRSTPQVPVLPHVGPVPASMVRRLACDADLIPAVLGTHNRVLDLGRSHRLVPAYLRQAMIARDGGCTFPGCTVPATWCEAHHIVPWWEGGTTTLDGSALLCPAHHHAVHTADWRIERTATGALTFTPPWATTPNLTHNSYHLGT